MSVRRRVMVASAAIVGVSFAGVLTVLFLDGHFPAAIPEGDVSISSLHEVLQAVDAHGEIDLFALRAHEPALRHFVDSLAAVAPTNVPERFPTPDDKLAYWLNAYHSLVLLELLESPSAERESDLSRLRTWPIGGRRLNRWSIERRFLSDAQDARVNLALFTGARGNPLLDDVPYDGQLLDGQLNDAARRVMRRKEMVGLAPGHVALGRIILQHEAEFLDALPEGRKHVLQIVWAFLPTDCDAIRPGCDTRKELDASCHNRFSSCTVSELPFDDALAIRRTR